jgi:serine/threonine protein kinase
MHVDDDASTRLVEGTGRFVAEAGPARLAPAHVIFAALALLCGVTAPVVLLLGRAPAPAHAAAAALGLQALICALLAILNRKGSARPPRPLQTVGLVVLGLLTAVPGYFFGPNSGFAAFVALALVLTGSLAGSTDVRFPWLTPWLTFLALAFGQAVVIALVLWHRLPDESLTLVIIKPHPMWHHSISHAALQILYLASFLSGRLFQRRYRALTQQVEKAVRLTARREALLDEVRAEYKRTLAAGGSGMFSGSTVGDYRLGHLLGRGGMAEVYEAVRLGDNKSVAVKLLRSDRIDDPQAIERFMEETEVATRVQSPLLARVYSVGRVQHGMPFIAMERLEGENLSTMLRRRGPLPLEELRGLIRDLSRALEAIHQKGIVHMDVNPSNVVRSAGEQGRPTWKLIDFGVARTKSAVPASSGPLGTLGFLAPEQLAGRDVDGRADVYGLAATLYSAITGHAPFEHVPPQALAAAVTGRLPVTPRRFVDIDEDVVHALRVGLAKDPADRYGSAPELREALLSALDGRLDTALRERARVLDWDMAWSDEEPKPQPTVEDTLPTPGPPPGEDDVREEPAAPTPGRVEAEAALRAESEAPPRPTLPPARTSIAPTAPWKDAYRSKMRGFYTGITALCAGGGLLMVMIARERGPLYFALACMAGIVAVAWLQRFLAARRPDAATYWPWAVVGVLSIGPAHCLGLHSGFAAVIVFWLFAGGIFRAARQAGWLERRGLVLFGILAAHTTLFILILARIVPDESNVAVLQAGLTPSRIVVMHLLLMACYAAAFFAGRTVDQRYEALTLRVEDAVRSAARQEALLVTVRSQLDLALAGMGGIFSGLEVGLYQVGRLLGRGGMGEVYEASRTDTGERVALKFIRVDRASQPRVLEMFLKEGRTLNLVRSPYVARVLEVAGMEHDLPYVALEYIEGRTLSEILREREQLSVNEVRDMVRHVARGLQDVHEAGILHRDIKPTNVILDESADPARWKLVDFGIAKLLAPDAAATGPLVVGTPAYMSPEHALGDRVDVRSDVYSLSLVVYRALAGRPAFTGNDPVEVARTALSKGPPDPAAWVDLPRDVLLALRIGLASRPEDRFASSAEFAAVFDDACEGKLSSEWRRRGADLARRQPWS